MKKMFLPFVMALMLVVYSCDKKESDSVLQDANILKSAKKVLNFRAHLSGASELPPVISEASGQAIFQLNKEGTVLRYKLIVDNIMDVSMAHLHMAQPGTNGGIVVWLYPSAPPAVPIPGTFSGILAEGEISSASLRGALAGQPLSALIDAIYAGRIYANAHTALHPGGEIRGIVAGTLPTGEE